MALFDLKGKLLGISAAELMGGRVRDTVECYATGMYFRKEPERKLLDKILAEAGEYISQGYGALKIKVGKNLAFDKRLIAEMRHAFPDIRLMADSNHAYDLPEAIEIGRVLGEHRSYCGGPTKALKIRGIASSLGGKAVAGDGYFMEPTILRDVRTNMRVAGEEIIGPVLPIIPFADRDDEIALANGTPYGLAAYVFTTNLAKGLRAARDIQAGSVCANEPHYSVQIPHGGLKQSGVGRDGSRYSLEEYLTLKRVSVLIGP